MPEGMPLPEFWKGSLTSGRQGALRVRLTKDRSGHIKGSAILTDYIFGLGWSSLSGSLMDSHADLMLGPFWTVAPISSSGGKVSVDLDATNRVATGTWQTDIATGSLTLSAIDISRVRWWLWSLTLGLFLLLPFLYGLGLALLFLFSARGSVTLSAPLLILSLISAPFLFQRYIARVVAIFGIQALGPVQLGGQRTPTLRGPLFSSLDEYLALWTKALLIWLAEQPDGATAEEIKRWTTSERNPGEIQSEMAALLTTGCMKVDREKYQVTNLGRRYVAHCLEGYVTQD